MHCHNIDIHLNTIPRPATNTILARAVTAANSVTRPVTMQMPTSMLTAKTRDAFSPIMIRVRTQMSNNELIADHTFAMTFIGYKLNTCNRKRRWVILGFVDFKCI